MEILPLLTRELNVALRRPSTRRLQLGFGGGTMGLVFWGFLVWMGSSSTAAQTIFQGLVLLAVLGIILLSVFIASDTISRERREGTLGFLFLTDLESRDVVMGKFVSAGLVPGYALLAMFPGLALCSIAGGLTPGQFWRTVCALVVSLIFALSVSLCVSSMCTRQRSAQGTSALVLLCLNPVFLSFSATDWIYQVSPYYYWILLVVFALLSWAALGWSTVKLEKNWRDPEIVRRTSEETVRGRTGRLFRTEPVTWLMLRRSNSSAGRLRVLLPAFGIVLISSFAPPAQIIPVLLIILFLSQLILMCVTIVRTAHSFQQDRQDGTLELLLGTRLEISELFEGFYRAMLRRTRSTLWLFTIVAAVVSLLCFLNGTLSAALFPWAMAATLWITCLSMGWVGVFRSLMTNLPLMAMISAFARVSLLPLGLTLLLLITARVEIPKILLFWVMATGFLGSFFALDAKSALYRHGRELLLRPHSDKPPHIESEWSFVNWEEEITPPKPLLSQTVL